MKQPSRYMQRYLPGKSKIIYIVFGFSILILATILYPTFLLIILIMVVIGFSAALIEQPKTKKHYDNLISSRKSLSICEFSREFNCREIDTWVIRATYEEVQDIIPFKEKLPIKASDRLKEDLLLDDEDLDLDLVEKISQRTGRALRNYEDNPYYGKVITVKDLVLFFNNQERLTL